jgi:MFS family permease
MKHDADVPTRASAYFALTLLALIYMFNYVDRQIVAMLAQPIKSELGLSDTQLGLLSGLAFALVYSTFGIPVAWLADRGNRVRIVAASCAVWSLCTGLCGLAGNFLQLVLARAGVGIGESGGVPPSYSLISDYFPPAQRGWAIALYSLGLPLGATLGLALGGWVAANFGWRSAFFALAAPGLVLALLTILFVREPQRGAWDAKTKDIEETASITQCVREFMANRTLLILLFSCASCSMCFNAFGSWAPSLLLRSKGMTMIELAAQYSFVMGLALAAGMAASALITKYAGMSLRLYALLPAVAMLIGIPFYVSGILAPSWQASMWLLAIPMMLNVIQLAPTMAIVQNLAPPSQRSTASAIALLVYNLFGTGFGPLYTGVISDLAEPRYGTSSLQVAMLAVTPLILIAAGSLFWLFARLKSIENRMAQIA